MGGRAECAHLAPRRPAPPGAGAIFPPSGSLRGRASCSPCATARACARLRGGAAKWLWARSAIFGSRSLSARNVQSTPSRILLSTRGTKHPTAVSASSATPRRTRLSPTTMTPRGGAWAAEKLASKCARRVPQHHLCSCQRMGASATSACAAACAIRTSTALWGQPALLVLTCHRARQSRWSPAPGTRRARSAYQLILPLNQLILKL
jgi:hypothetical protein